MLVLQGLGRRGEDEGREAPIPCVPPRPSYPRIMGPVLSIPFRSRAQGSCVSPGAARRWETAET